MVSIEVIKGGPSSEELVFSSLEAKCLSKSEEFATEAVNKIHLAIPSLWQPLSVFFVSGAAMALDQAKIKAPNFLFGGVYGIAGFLSVVNIVLLVKQFNFAQQQLIRDQKFKDEITGLVEKFDKKKTLVLTNTLDLKNLLCDSIKQWVRISITCNAMGLAALSLIPDMIPGMDYRIKYTIWTTNFVTIFFANRIQTLCKDILLQNIEHFRDRCHSLQTDSLN